MQKRDGVKQVRVRNMNWENWAAVDTMYISIPREYNMHDMDGREGGGV